MSVTVVPVEELAFAPVTARRRALATLLHERAFVVGALVFLALGLGAFLTGHLLDPRLQRSGAFPPKLAPPAVVLGTTSLGQSVFAQLTVAIPNSILVGLVAATVGTVLGAAIGLCAGYFGGKVDAVLRVLIDVFLSVPSLLFLVLIASLLRGVGVPALALVIGLFAWAWPARAVRAQILSLKEQPFVQLGLLGGLSGIEIVWRELLPHLLPWLGANFVNAFIAAILAESGLSILGLGSQRDVTLGQMIYWALSYGAILQNLWWWWLTPVVALVLLFLSLYLVHLGLDAVTNPRARTAG
jgi:peptide/nickel transport system permease protein